MAIRLLVLLILISLIKGGIQTAVKVVLEGFPPMGFVASRNLLALAVMVPGALALARFRTREAWWPSIGVRPLVTTGFLLSGTFLLFFNGMLYTSASRATVISSAQPLFVLVLARAFIKGEKITFSKTAGLVLGMAGIGLLVVSSHVQAEGSWAFRGDALVLGGTVLWSIQSIYEKRILPNYRPFTIVVWQIALSSVVMWILWAIFERDQAVVLNTRTVSAFLYMVFPVTIFVYLTYMYALQYVQVSQISYFNFVMTVSGVLLGVLILGEPVTLPLVLSMLLVCGGVVLVMRPDSEDRHRDVAPTVPR